MGITTLYLYRILYNRRGLKNVQIVVFNICINQCKNATVFVPNTSLQNKKIIINLIKRLNSADTITLVDVNSDSDVQLNEALSSKEFDNKIKTIS